MKVVFISITGQTRKFVQKLDMDTLEITLDNAFTEIDEPYVVVVPTYDIEATSIVNDFIETGDNVTYLKGVAGGGNLNFNALFCFTARDLSKKYNVPIIHEFEFQGSVNDVNKFKEEVAKLG